MNSSLLFHRFSTAVTWNIYLHIIYKTAFILRTIMFYRILTAQDFSTWANLNSIIFLQLLWLDFGLRKSIPQFAPIFSTMRTHMMARIIFLQTTILILALPALLFFLSYTTTSYSILFVASGIYLAEGLNNSMRSFYHAYFHNRSFNIMAMVIAVVEIALTLFGIMTISHQYLLGMILAIKLLATITLIIASCMQFTSQLPPISIPAQQIDQSAQQIAFSKHSLIMWITTIAASISERNFMVPLLTHTLGIPAANIFKLANDGALFFYRMIIKTLGSADTALLAHIEVGAHDAETKQKLVANAVQKLSAKITRLALPLLGILGIIMVSSSWFWNDQYVFHAFLIMAIGYIAQTVWIPYERVLEAKQQYRLLFLSHIPYGIVMIALVVLLWISSIGFIQFLLCVHGVRLVTGICMRYFVYRLYNV